MRATSAPLQDERSVRELAPSVGSSPAFPALTRVMAPGRTLQKPLPAPVSSSSSSPRDGLPASPSLRAAHGKQLKLIILLETQGAHLAGREVRGWLEVSVSSKELWLGELGIELHGLEGEPRRPAQCPRFGSRHGHAAEKQSGCEASTIAVALARCRTEALAQIAARDIISQLARSLDVRGTDRDSARPRPPYNLFYTVQQQLARDPP